MTVLDFFSRYDGYKDRLLEMWELEAIFPMMYDKRGLTAMTESKNLAKNGKVKLRQLFQLITQKLHQTDQLPIKSIYKIRIATLDYGSRDTLNKLANICSSQGGGQETSLGSTYRESWENIV